MREPSRFRDGGEDLLAATLLDAARAYRRPPSARARIAKALGFPIAVSVAAPAVAAASSLAAKMVIIVSAATIATSGGVVAYRIHTDRQARRALVTTAAPVAVAVVRHAPTSFAPPTLEPSVNTGPKERPIAMARANATPRIASVVPSFERPEPRRRHAVEPVSHTNETLVPRAPPATAIAMAAPVPPMKPAPPAPPLSPLPFPSVVRAGVPAASLATPSTPSRPAAAPAPVPQQLPLAREIELLDAAERAERRGDHGAALVALDEYVRAFPEGALLAESKVLRIAALVGRGDRSAAQDLGRAFLARYAPSPLGGRVRSMLPEISNPKKELP